MRQIISPATPVGYLELVLRARAARASARARDENGPGGERGASAVEWVVISAITLAIAIAIGAILLKALTDKATTVSGNISGA